MDGFDGLERELRDLERTARALDGSHEISFNELFHPAFMAHNTQFRDIDAMLDASPFTVKTSEDFERILDDEWDRYVAAHTRFANWEEMQGAAVDEWAAKKLGL
jgi:hypothetical protein